MKYHFLTNCTIQKDDTVICLFDKEILCRKMFGGWHTLKLYAKSPRSNRFVEHFIM